MNVNPVLQWDISYWLAALHTIEMIVFAVAGCILFVMLALSIPSTNRVGQMVQDLERELPDR